MLLLSIVYRWCCCWWWWLHVDKANLLLW